MILRAALSEVRQQQATRGHLPDGSSVQKHSAGSNYPYIVGVREDVDSRWGQAEVTDSMMNVLFAAFYPLDNKVQRLAAYEMAIDAADAFAQAARIGVMRQ